MLLSLGLAAIGRREGAVLLAVTPYMLLLLAGAARLADAALRGTPPVGDEQSRPVGGERMMDRGRTGPVTLTRLAEFFRMEASGGIILMAAAVAAIILANSPAAAVYGALLDTPVSVQAGALKVAKPLLLWINDGLMQDHAAAVRLGVLGGSLLSALAGYAVLRLSAPTNRGRSGDAGDLSW